MAYSELLADRIREALWTRKVQAVEKKMMGGLTFMVNEKMCVGIIKNELMVRIGPKRYVDALKREGCRPMDFTGKPMKGYVFVGDDGMDSEADFEHWIDEALAFNKELGE